MLSPAEVRRLLCGIETDTEQGLRDRAMLAPMIYGFVRAGVLPGLRVGDYERDSRERWLRLHAVTGMPHRVPLHPQAAAYLDVYLGPVGIGDDAGGWLFRAAQGHGRAAPRLATGGAVLRMVKTRCRAAGLELAIGAHTLRAVGIALFLEEGGSIEQVKTMADFRSDHPMARYLGRGPAAKRAWARAPSSDAHPREPEHLIV